jgi:hypothetical protein
MRTPRLSFLFAIVIALLLGAGSAHAHDFWLERQDGAFVLRYGHHGGEALALDAA